LPHKKFRRATTSNLLPLEPRAATHESFENPLALLTLKPSSIQMSVVNSIHVNSSRKDVAKSLKKTDKESHTARAVAGDRDVPKRQATEQRTSRRSAFTTLPKFLVQDKRGLKALQATRVAKCTGHFVSTHAFCILKIWLCYYTISFIVALYSVCVGTAFTILPVTCSPFILAALFSYGCANVLVSLLTFCSPIRIWEFVLLVNLSIGFLNLCILIYFIATLYADFWPKSSDECNVANYSATAIMAFIATVFIITLIFFHIAGCTMIWSAWNAKQDHIKQVKQKRRVVRGGITEYYV